MGLLQTENDKWKVLKFGNTNILSHEVTDRAKTHLQRQILKMAEEALEKISINERSQTAMTFAMNSKLLPLAISEIDLFRRGLTHKLQKEKSRDRVYHLSISLYPVSTLEQLKNKPK